MLIVFGSCTGYFGKIITKMKRNYDLFFEIINIDDCEEEITQEYVECTPSMMTGK